MTLIFLTMFVLQASPPRWEYQPPTQSSLGASEARLRSRDGLATLVIRCDVVGDPTLSIQYKPGKSMGLSMAPVILDWYPVRSSRLAANIVWEPDRTGAYARDGIDDRHASEVAEAIRNEPGTLHIISADRAGERFDTFFDSDTNRGTIGEIIAKCPWHP